KHEKAFYTDLKKFVDDYKPLVDSAGNIRCPCKSCRLVLWVSIKHLSDHISKYRFDPSYKTWIHHGEADLPPPPLVIDNTRQPQMSDMTACLNELIKEILVRQVTTRHNLNVTSSKSYMPVPTRSCSPVVTMLGYESIHAYVNDCFLFLGDANKDVHFCPVCNTSRWKDSNTPGKKVPKKVLRYFPIIPRLQCLYKSSHTAKEMTWHATGKYTEPGKMQHPVDGKAWKDFDTKYSDFAVEPRNVRLGLAADGFNPFSNLSQSYSMWPANPGVKTIDFATGLKFNMRAMVLWTINDFLLEVVCLGGVGKVTRHALHVMKTLHLCVKPNKWRRSLEFNGEIENGDPLREFSRDAIMTQLARLPTRMKGKHPRHHQGKTRLEKAGHSKWLVARPKQKRKVLEASGCVFFHTRGQKKVLPIRPRWIYPFKRYMKKLKNYERNKSKPEGSIAEVYVAEEALTFSSHYFWDVTTKFNRPDHNVDCPPPTCQLWVFKSLCKSIGLRSIIRIDHQELKKVIWYVLHNSPEIDTYRAKFRIEFPNKYMKEEFPGWFGKQIHQRHVDNDLGVNESSELFTLACGPSHTPISVNSCVVNDGVIVVEDDPDVIHVDNSSDLALSTSLNDLEIAALHIDGQSIDVDAPPDIIDFDLRPNMESDRWPQIYAGIHQHLPKIYNGKKAALKERYWVPEEDGSYDLERIRRGRPSHISEADWDAQLAFWNDPKNLARAAQN
nr:hypothetical protein [Tanacetum cinerariifolium]